MLGKKRGKRKTTTGRIRRKGSGEGVYHEISRTRQKGEGLREKGLEDKGMQGEEWME